MALGLARVLAFWPPEEDLWYAASSASEICYRSPVTTRLTTQLRRQLDAILHHHALAVWVALDLLAYEWRSEKIGRQLDALDGLGEPAAHLDQLYAELAERPTADYAAS